MQGLVHFHLSGGFGLLRVVLGRFGFCFGGALSVHRPVVFPVGFGLPVTGSFYLRLGLGQNGITQPIQLLVVCDTRETARSFGGTATALNYNISTFFLAHNFIGKDQTSLFYQV